MPPTGSHQSSQGFAHCNSVIFCSDHKKNALAEPPTKATGKASKLQRRSWRMSARSEEGI